MYSNLFKTGLAMFMGNRQRLRMADADSLISFTEAARVEPIVLIDQSVMHYASIGDVQQSLLAQFAGYYLQAAALTNQLGSIAVMNRLEPLNPTRSAKNTLLSGTPWMIATESHHSDSANYGETPSWMMQMEAYADGLPMPTNDSLRLAVESNASTAAPVKPTGRPEPKPMAAMQANVGSVDKGDLGRSLNELVNLSVGKMYSVELVEGQNKFTMPVAIRLIASAMPTRDLIHILSTGSEDNSMKERWHGWQSGRLEFWKDLVLCTDLVDQHRRDILSDKSGTLAKLNKVQRSNQLATIVSGNPTVSSASNLAIISRETADELELQLEGKLDKFDIRQRMMKHTYLMILAVVDQDYSRVTFYHRGIATPTQVRLGDLKASNKGSGPDIGEILKAYQMGAAPSL